jgi:hypothetical protein
LERLLEFHLTAWRYIPEDKTLHEDVLGENEGK